MSTIVNSPAPQEIRLADYKPTPFQTKQTRLHFELNDDVTRVVCEQDLVRRPGADATDSLVLQGVELELLDIAIDGESLSGNQYQLTAETLTISSLPDTCTLRVTTNIYPQSNTALEGLYQSGGMYCTQCEAEGFRKITYFQDRPDVLSVYTTKITADAKRFPNLLANGNCIVDTTEGARRTVTWYDPHPKPSYLFAMVAGDLAMVEDAFVTASGRDIKLQIFTEPHNIDQCDYAMQALKRAMTWDEEVYGREYDLDIFMIVAVDDFNMGAMENKGLNIFNTSCVLATPDTATDQAYQRIEGVVAHEYFHNWSGNRVTCRDWFQLSLKEGFTVFRDAEFSSDMNSRTVKRIEDVSFLRSVQFAEDSGPLAHPIRPTTYLEISNFYTTTIYEKGSEVVRMLHTSLGADTFRAGSDLYFDRHDGEAATTEDFVRCMEEASGQPLTTFRRWYEQAGTPVLTVATRWNPQARCYDMEFAQATPATPGQDHKEPTHIPILVGFLDAAGGELDPGELTVEASMPTAQRERSLILHLTEDKGRVRLENLDAPPTPSLLRGFSAPVRVDWERSAAELQHLAQHDSDGFARWDALQTLLVRELTVTSSTAVPELFAELLQQALSSPRDAQALGLAAEMLTLPTVSYLFEQVEQVDPLALAEARHRLQSQLAISLADGWLELYQNNSSHQPYAPDAASIARRRLRNLSLSYLSAVAKPNADLVLEQLHGSDNFTDRRAALVEVANAGWLTEVERREVLNKFYEQWQHQGLVVNQWLGVMSTSRFTDVASMQALEQHSSFDQFNPNKLRALLGGFSQVNFENFHHSDGSGYHYLAHKLIELDGSNPQMASRISGPLTTWRRMVEPQQTQMRRALESIRDIDSLSKDLFEVVHKALDE